MLYGIQYVDSDSGETTTKVAKECSRQGSTQPKLFPSTFFK